MHTTTVIIRVTYSKYSFGQNVEKKILLFTQFIDTQRNFRI